MDAAAAAREAKERERRRRRRKREAKLDAEERAAARRKEQESFDIQSYERAKELGVDVTLEEDYIWVGHEFSRAGVPEPWSEYSDDHGQIFYYNHENGESQWVHPLIDTFKALLAKCKEEPTLMTYFKSLYGNLRGYCDSKKGWWALNLLITPNDSAPPMPEEVLDMAKYLQINVKKEPELTWIAKQAVQVPLPPNWEEHEDPEGNTYFYDRTLGKSQLKHPLDDYFFALVSEERKKIPEKRRMSRGRDLTVGWMPFVDDQGMNYYVSFQYNVQTYYPPWEKKYNRAAKIIQRFVRRKQARQRLLHEMARKIQKVYRGHVVRDAVNAWRQECAALCIQTMYRMYRARMDYLMDQSAIIIQSCWRMFVCRKAFKRHQAAVRIQCAWRCHVARVVLRRLKAAARIQSCWRGYKDRQRVKVLRKHNAAATVIQARMRGILGRRCAHEMARHRAATLIQSHVRRRIGARLMREERYRQKLHTATLTIQCGVRRWIAQNRLRELKLEVRKEEAAIYIQRCYRGFEGRQYVRWIRRTRAAVVIQRAFRRYWSWRGPQRKAAAITIQRIWRGHKDRDRIEYMMKHEWNEINTAAQLIQRHWRGYHQRKCYKQLKAALMIQRYIRGRQQRKNYRYEKAAIKIQKWWRGASQRKKWLHKIFMLKFMAHRMQCLYRLYVSHRQAIVARMMFEYKVAMAKRIQAAWHGYRARNQHKEHMRVLTIKKAAAVKIQKAFRGHAGRSRAAFMARAYVIIQSCYRGHVARKELRALKALANTRKTLLDSLEPLYEALFVLPTAHTLARRAKLVHGFILRDQFPKGGDLMCAAALAQLEMAANDLTDTCEARATERDSLLHTFRVTWRLTAHSDPFHKVPVVPEEGEPGWISDEVMATLRAEQDRLRLLKMESLAEFYKQAKSWLSKLWDELPVQPSWRKKCKAASSKTQSLDGLDAMLEEIGRLEEFRPVTAHLAGHLKRRMELQAKRAELPSKNALMMDRSAGSEKRKKQAEATVAMLDLEEPRTNRLLFAALSEIHKNQADLPVTMEMLMKVTGCPDLETLRVELEESKRAQQLSNPKKKRPKDMSGLIANVVKTVIADSKNKPSAEVGGLDAAPPRGAPPPGPPPPAGPPPSWRNAASGFDEFENSDEEDADFGEFAVEKAAKKRPARRKKKPKDAA